MEIKDLAPQAVWKYFAEICNIPHPTFHEKKVIDYIQNFAEQQNLDWKRDAADNIVVKKPATPGKENAPTVVLQAHVDMVPQKNSDKTFDFLKDAIQPYIDGEWVKANGTTLGSDDGMGVAAMLAVLSSKDIEHPNIECLFTVSEEDGMVGANALQGDMLEGRILINLDSEEDGELYVGCAGGTNNNVHMSFPVEQVSPSDYIFYNIELKGLKGGHSGIQIILQRANANKVATRFIREQGEENGIRLSSFSGGNMRNAIPREAFLTVAVPKENEAGFLQAVSKYEADINFENASQEEGITFRAVRSDEIKAVMSQQSQLEVIRALTAMPHGVFRMSDSMPGLVETSTNLSIVNIKCDETCKLDIKCMTRCLVNYGRREVNAMIRCIWEQIGAEVIEDGEYNGWAPNMDSPLLAVMKDCYKQLFGKEPRVAAIHAGLEAGIIGDKYNGMDMISIGPTLQYPHSPDERVNIASVSNFYNFILHTLKSIS